MTRVERVSTPLLIAETNPYFLKALRAVLSERLPTLHFDICATLDHIIWNLVTYRYESVISNLQLAGVSESFLRRNELLPPYVPLVITAAASDQELASRALNEGAFDLIMNPLNADETLRTIRLALWHGKLLRLIHGNEASIEKYREHIRTYPDNVSITADFSKTLNQISDFSAFATRIEEQTRIKALERLSVWREEAEAP